MDDRRSLIIGVRLFINVVRRSKIKRLQVKLAGKEPLRQLHFKVQLTPRDVGYIRLSVRIVPDLVPFAKLALHYADILNRLISDNQKRSFDALLIQNIENA